MMAMRRLWLLALTLLAACSAVSDPTRIVVEVESDLSVPRQLDRVTLEVTGQEIDGAAEADLRDKDLPRTVTLVHESGPLGPIYVTVHGWSGTTEVARKQVATWFQERRDAYLTILLTRDCLNVLCQDGESCEEGRCVPVDGDAGVVSVGDASVKRDAGGDAAAPRDAGADASTDAGRDAAVPSTDAAVADASTPPVDAGAQEDASTPPPPRGRRPTCTIDRPVQNDVIQVKTPFVLRGSCSDPETGDLTQGLVWTSQIDGPLAEGAVTTGSVRSAGAHQISLCAPDPRDASWIGCGAVEVQATVGPQPAAQIVSVTQLGSALPPYYTGAPITLTGIGSGASVTLSWTDSLQGPLGTGARVTLQSPQAGTHIVTLTVRDRDGKQASVTDTFLVRDRRQGPVP